MNPKLFGLWFLVSLNIAAHAQTQKRQIIDFSCIAQKPVVPCKYEFEYNGRTAVQEGSLKLKNLFVLQSLYGPQDTSGALNCLGGVLASPPPDCVSEVYSASDVNKLLADQARQFREQQARLCRRIATKPEDCDSAFVD